MVGLYIDGFDISILHFGAFLMYVQI